jgi:hypothetical protein
MSDAQKLKEIAKWCDLWLSGGADPKWTVELISGIQKIAKAGSGSSRQRS